MVLYWKGNQQEKAFSSKANRSASGMVDNVHAKPSEGCMKHGNSSSHCCRINICIKPPWFRLQFWGPTVLILPCKPVMARNFVTNQNTDLLNLDNICLIVSSRILLAQEHVFLSTLWAYCSVCLHCYCRYRTWFLGWFGGF